MTRILHTADWHLGARLVENDRTEEHRLFLHWLLHVVRREKPDVLLVAGDVFDTTNPPQSAVELYFGFLAAAQATPGTRIVVTGGNHDSPLALNAPAGVLQRLDVHVHGCPPEKLDHCITEYPDVVLCAVPYLRERDVRIARAGQSSDAIAAEIREGIAAYYRRVLEHGRERAAGRAVIASGHLTVLGSVTSDSEREIHIGNLGAVDAGCFAGFDYVALGHLHKPQEVGTQGRIRYSGSPFPLSFDDAANEKSVVLVDVQPGQPPRQTLLPIPRFRTLARVRATLETLDAALASVPREAAPGSPALAPWVELTLLAEPGAVDPARHLREAADKAGVAILKCSLTCPAVTQAQSADTPTERSLAEMPAAEVFAERLRAEGIDPAGENGRALTLTFVELLSRMNTAEREGLEVAR